MSSEVDVVQDCQLDWALLDGKPNDLFRGRQPLARNKTEVQERIKLFVATKQASEGCLKTLQKEHQFPECFPISTFISFRLHSVAGRTPGFAPAQ